MTTQFDSHDAIEKNCGVTVERDVPEFNHLYWNTLRKLGFTGPPPGKLRAIALVFLGLMRRQATMGTVYVNPLSKVTAPRLSADFIRQARQEQMAWFRRLKDCLYFMKQVKQRYRGEKHFIRQLEFSGVMIIEGRHVFPNQWPRIQDLQLKRGLAGRSFGRLVALQDLPRGECHCQCRCGNRTIVKRKHLLAERTKSCGCLRIESEARIQLKRSARNRS